MPRRKNKSTSRNNPQPAVGGADAPHLVNRYLRALNAIVAFVPRNFDLARVQAGECFPPIFGTGFLVSTDGYVLTCRHVVDAFGTPQKDEENKPVYPFLVMMVYFVPPGQFGMPAGKGMHQVYLFDIVGVANVQATGIVMGSSAPDLVVVRLRATAFPNEFKIFEKAPPPVLPGMRVATVGWPLGDRALYAQDFNTKERYLHQVCPMLQEGIVRAILPHPFTVPHTIVVDMVSQRGQSGSPVFQPETGRVIGLLYAGMPDIYEHEKRVYPVPSSITYVVPWYYLRGAVDAAARFKSYHLPDDTPDVSKMIERSVQQWCGAQEKAKRIVPL